MAPSGVDMFDAANVFLLFLPRVKLCVWVNVASCFSKAVVDLVICVARSPVARWHRSHWGWHGFAAGSQHQGREYYIPSKQD